jgi:Ca-activated chloride channel family protein
MRTRYRRVVPAALLALMAAASPAAAQDVSNPSTIVFRSSIDVVSVTAVVRDRKGHTVSTLTRDQFEVVDAGQLRPILHVQADGSSPTSIALLIDGSGSMRMGGALEFSRAVAHGVLSSLNPVRDDAALLSFDSRLLTLQEFTSDFDRIRASLADVQAWGTTSLYDAIAGAAGIVGERTQNRRAIIVLTDGADNASEYSPEDVGRIASSIDVPVYVFSLASSAAPMAGGAAHHRRSTLAQLAHATGGEYIVADTPNGVEAGIRRVVDDLRHQYLISFEAAAFEGLRRIEIRTRHTDLRVRSRGWYQGRAGE